MLKGKIAIVTGSTSGIGLGIAQELANAGAHILINGFGDKDAIEKERKGLEENYGIKARYHGADVTKPDQLAEMLALADKELGGVDILVNNAGIQFVAPIDEFPPEKWDAVIATNLSSVFHSTRLALPYMKKKGFGRVINIASAHGLVASGGKSAYVAAKHGVVGLTKVTAIETADFNITCNAICPGWVLTPLVEKQINDKAAAQGVSPDKARADLLSEKQPVKRFATIAEIGQLAVYLASESARSVNGTTISIDNGWTAQ